MEITKETVGRVISQAGQPELPVTFTWSSDLPIMVKATFHMAVGETVEWVLALELLAEGLVSSGAGIGDLRVWPAKGDANLVFISIKSPEGAAVVSFPWDTLNWFATAIVTKFSSDDEAKRMAEIVDAFLAELNIESF